MTEHIRPASFGTLEPGNQIPKGTAIGFMYADRDGEDWSAINGTLDQSIILGPDETGRDMPTADAMLRDASGAVSVIAVDRILDFHIHEED